MPEFFDVLPPEDALETLRRHVSPKIAVETVSIGEALGRYLARDVHAETDLPTFARSSMDGYSVRARDTFGASESLPAYLTVVGDVPTGVRPSMSLGVGETAGAHTGGMLALGADAVVMVEQYPGSGRADRRGDSRGCAGRERDPGGRGRPRP